MAIADPEPAPPARQIGAWRLFKLNHGYRNAVVGGWAPIGPRQRRPFRWIDETVAPPLRRLLHNIIPDSAGA